MKIMGYALMRADLDGLSPEPLNSFVGGPIKVLEFSDNSILALNRKNTGIGDFEYRHVYLSFRCEVEAGVICPPDLTFEQRMVYIMSCNMRKGGYNKTLADMVLAASLSQQKFCDDFLWALHPEDKPQTS